MRRALVVIVVAACTSSPGVIDAGACGLSLASWPEADALFTRDPQWIGADAAYSVDLGGGRVLWLFGDTFVAKDASRSRSSAWFVRNSVAIQTGYDPSTATAKFFWGTSGGASSFFPENGTHWFWPLSGVRLPSRLVLFLLEEENGSGGLGFQAVGTKVVSVTNPDADPSGWNVAGADLPAFSFPIAFGAAALADGAYVYAFGDEEPGDHSVYVARFDASALDAGDASSPLFWTNGAWAPPGATAPDVIFPSGSALENPPTEFSVQKSADGFLAVHSVGFGATQIAVRTAPAPEGPWTAACDAFTPPESSRSGVLVYAAKGHPELTGGALVATYATNATDLGTLASDMSLYFHVSSGRHERRRVVPGRARRVRDATADVRVDRAAAAREHAAAARGARRHAARRARQVVDLVRELDVGCDRIARDLAGRRVGRLRRTRRTTAAAASRASRRKSSRSRASTGATASRSSSCAIAAARSSRARST